MPPGPVWLDDTDIQVLHDRILALHGGATGLRDEALLALAGSSIDEASYIAFVRANITPV